MAYCYKIILTSDEDRGWRVEVPAISGCVAFGSTRAEALGAIRDAVESCLESLSDSDLPIPRDELSPDGESIIVVDPLLKPIGVAPGATWSVGRSRARTLTRSRSI